MIRKLTITIMNYKLSKNSYYMKIGQDYYDEQYNNIKHL